MYSVHVSFESGKGSYLSVKGRSEWKTKRTAIKHARDVASLESGIKDALELTVEDEHGRCIESFRTSLA